MLALLVNGYPFAGPLSFQYGNNAQYSQSLDQDYRPLISVDGPRTKRASYDPAGNLGSLIDSTTNTTLTYGYDASGRLVSAIDSATGSFGSLGYSYDKNGNRQTETRNASVLTYVYASAGSNWLYQRGSDTRSKQANGNTTSGSTFGTLAYDGYNRIAQLPMENMFYSYNAVGERIKKVNPNGLGAYFHYGQNGELLYEQDANGNTKAYVWLDGRPLARIDNDANIYYYRVDHLGSPHCPEITHRHTLMH